MKRINQILISLGLMTVVHTAQAACSGRLLVSDYSADNVVVFNACSGEQIRLLDTNNRLNGPQAIRLGPDQMIYVVSEENARIIRYNQQTLDYVDTFIFQNAVTPGDDLGGISRPTGLAFGSDGDLYIGGFQSDNIGRFDGQSGLFKSIVYAGGQALDGPDAGMIFDNNEQLLVPSYENSLILRINPTTGQVTQTIQHELLDRPRVILPAKEGQEMVVSSWAAGKILRFGLDNGEFISEVGGNSFRPAALELIDSSQLLIGSDATRGISRRDLNTGESLTPLIENASSPLQTATFMMFLPDTSSAAVNEQYWLVGTGPISGTQLEIPQAVTATGGVFGEDFDPEAIQRPVWGRLNIDFTSCTEALLSYESGDLDQAGFGSGGYALIKGLPNPAQLRCEATGFDTQTDHEWMTGTWFGGPERSGEGFLIDVFGDQAFVAWFTFNKTD